MPRTGSEEFGSAMCVHTVHTIIVSQRADTNSPNETHIVSSRMWKMYGAFLHKKNWFNLRKNVQCGYDEDVAFPI